MFGDQILAFSENLDNLRDFVEMVSEFLHEKSKQGIKDNAINLSPFILAMHKLNPDEFELDEESISKIEEKFGSKIKLELVDGEKGKGDKKGVRFKLEGDGNKKFGAAVKIVKVNKHRLTALYCNSLISLVSSVEWFLAQLIHKHYKENPGIVGAKEKQFSLEELNSFDSVEDARDFLIEKTVETILRGSIEDWIEFLKSKLKLSMGYIKEHKKHLIEAIQRRNLLVHNGGIVNRIYVSNYPEELGPPPEIGEKIDVSSEYLSETISTFERCFLLIAAELWKKIGKDDAKRGKIFINLAYEHLLAERYDVAESLSLFSSNDKSLQEADQLYAKINYWIAKKFGDGFDAIRVDVENEDFSAKSRLFILAKNVLLDNFEDAHQDIEYLLEHDDDFSFEKVKTWPLFKEFREQGIYHDMLNQHTVTPVNNETETTEVEGVGSGTAESTDKTMH